ncbi:MAG TPA: hypothetical protein VGM50_08900, partial [Gemmatimonadaceae bacterium]
LGAVSFRSLNPSAQIACNGPRGRSIRPTLQENVMKRLAFVAAVLAVTACSKSDNAAKDTSAPAMAPAPAPAAQADTGMKMMDTAMKKMDTAAAKMDSAAKKKKP